MHTQDPRIDTYLSTIPSWQKEVFTKARMLIRQADPEVVETIKRTTLPFFTLNGNICAFMSTKDHANILIYDPIAPDPHHIINQGNGNMTARAIQIFEGKTLDEKAFVQLIREVIKNNRVGGWRKIKKD